MVVTADSNNGHNKASKPKNNKSQNNSHNPPAAATTATANTIAGKALPLAYVNNMHSHPETHIHAVSKSKLHQLYDELPDEALAKAARTYTSRLHQLQLQREHCCQTLQRLADGYVPFSCQFRFELGASPAVKETAEYNELKETVTNTLQQCTTTLAQSVASLQLLEVKVKEQEIAHTFCEGLSFLGVAFVNYHRDQPTAKIAKTMQSQRLCDRLVELLMEQYPEVLEFSYLTTTNTSSGTSNESRETDTEADAATNNTTPNENTKDVFMAYYKQIGRDMPTHSRLQNQNHKSSPYNDYHTKFLNSILAEFHEIVDACFRVSWKDYLQERRTVHRDPSSKKSTAKHDKKETRDAGAHHSNNGNSSAVTAVSSYPPRPPPQQQHLQEDRIKDMVQTAVLEETQALRDIVRQLEEKLTANLNNNDYNTATAKITPDEKLSKDNGTTSEKGKENDVKSPTSNNIKNKKGGKSRNRNRNKNKAKDDHKVKEDEVEAKDDPKVKEDEVEAKNDPKVKEDDAKQN